MNTPYMKASIGYYMNIICRQKGLFMLDTPILQQTLKKYHHGTSNAGLASTQMSNYGSMIYVYEPQTEQ